MIWGWGESKGLAIAEALEGFGGGWRLSLGGGQTRKVPED